MARPVLWSFRRCPYAMRARLAVLSSGVACELREIVLRDKPDAFLAASPSATVPCLEGPEGPVDESLDIMLWALKQHDPERLLEMPEAGHALIAACDGPFKGALDRYKYETRYEGVDAKAERAKASSYVAQLNTQLAGGAWLFGNRPTLADLAILPFVRQFAHVDLDWFESQPWPEVSAWLAAFKASPRFKAIMGKYAPWQAGEAGVDFPEKAHASE